MEGTGDIMFFAMVFLLPRLIICDLSTTKFKSPDCGSDHMEATFNGTKLSTLHSYSQIDCGGSCSYHVDCQSFSFNSGMMCSMIRGLPTHVINVLAYFYRI